MFAFVQNPLKKRKYKGDTWQSYEDDPETIERLFNSIILDDPYSELNSVILTRLAKHIPSVKHRLLDIIYNNENNNSTNNKNSSSNSIVLDDNDNDYKKVMRIVTGLQYERILPEEIWNHYQPSVMRWIEMEGLNEMHHLEDVLTDECK